MRTLCVFLFHQPEARLDQEYVGGGSVEQSGQIPAQPQGTIAAGALPPLGPDQVERRPGTIFPSDDGVAACRTRAGLVQESEVALVQQPT